MGIFDGLVFYIIGYVGRGSLFLRRKIRENGGKITLVYYAGVTHIITRNLCHAKVKQYKNATEKRKLFVVLPDFVQKCIEENCLIDPNPFLVLRQKSVTITEYFDKSSV